VQFLCRHNFRIQAIQKDQKQELLRSLQQSDSVIAGTITASSSNRKFNEAEFFERMKQFEDSRAKSSIALKIHQEHEQLKEVLSLRFFCAFFFEPFAQCTFTPFTHSIEDEKRLHKQQGPPISVQTKRSTSPSYASLHGRSRSAASSRTTTPLKNVASSSDSRVFERVNQLLDTSVASATSVKRTAFEKVSMDLLFANTH
jgi:hypothetical protein